MEFTPINIDHSASTLPESFGVSIERHSQLVDNVESKMLDNTPDSRSGVCKMFIEEAQTIEEAILLAFSAGFLVGCHDSQ